MFTSLGNVIPTDWARRYTFDGNGNSTTGSNNASVLNGIWVKTERMYQSQCLSWGATTSCTYASVTYTNSYIWIYSSGVWIFTKNSSKVTATALNGVNGERYAGLTFFNRTLTADEEQLLQLEGQKLLGPTNIAKYPKLFEGLVGYFENPTGTTELWNIANGVNSTRVAGSNTTDNLGNNRALSNPNYTWTSITYTTGYTFENSGSGWSIVTNPLGLLGTGINRVTTLRNVFLFTRTLSSDEVTLLQNLCNSNYIYPNPSYDLPNLRDGLVLDLNEQGKDLSGNGNNGTLVNSPTVVRQGKAKGLSYNGSNQYIDMTESSTYNFTTPFTVYTYIKLGTTGTTKMIFANYHQVSSLVSGYQFNISSGNKINFTTGRGTGAVLGTNYQTVNGTTSLTTGIWYFVAGQWDGSNLKVFLNGVQDGTISWANSPGGYTSNIRTNVGANEYQPGTIIDYFNGTIMNPIRVVNSALSTKELQAIYYATKGNFIY